MQFFLYNICGFIEYRDVNNRLYHCINDC